MVGAVEMPALLQVLTTIAQVHKDTRPKLWLSASPGWVTRESSTVSSVKSTILGQVLADDPAICSGPTPELFLLSQAIARGSAVATHYAVFNHRGELPLQPIEDVLQCCKCCPCDCSCLKCHQDGSNVIWKPPRQRLWRILVFL